jgi:phosphoribosylamine--glycine ligase
MRILVVGGGGREHALVKSLAASPRVREVFCAPGNGGIARDATCVPISPENTVELARFAEELSVDLTVVGPEMPLSLGIADIFRRRDLRIFGPGTEAAQLESSKVFAKRFMERNAIPSAPFRVCNSFEEASEAIKSGDLGFPVVLKADGLAAGKGVLICDDEQAALDGAHSLLVEKRFGPAGERILVEKFLTGIEVSFMVLSDGERFLPLIPSCDYKKAFDGDKGPNTGGMGAYAPSTVVDINTHRRILTEIVGPTIGAMMEEGRPYSGVLYCGLILTDSGPQVLEYNCRFGDPETQVVLPLLRADLYEILFVAAEGNMRGVRLYPPENHAVTVVIAAEGYPGSYNKGMPIAGLDKAAEMEGIFVYHAGTKLEDGTLVTSGGRVLNVTAVAPELPRATYNAYKAAELIRFEGARYRGDIAHNAMKREIG